MARWTNITLWGKNPANECRDASLNVQNKRWYSRSVIFTISLYHIIIFFYYTFRLIIIIAMVFFIIITTTRIITYFLLLFIHKRPLEVYGII